VTIILTSEVGLDTVAKLAAQLRVDSIRSSTSAGSGHPTAPGRWRVSLRA
jgi:transketolase